MTKLPDDEYKIQDKDEMSACGDAILYAIGVPGARETRPQSDVKKLSQGEEAWTCAKMAQRRRNIRAGRDAMDGVIEDARVRGLFDLGEIYLSEALFLDYFAQLQPAEQTAVLDNMREQMLAMTDDYYDLNMCIGTTLAAFDLTNSLAVTALHDAKKKCMTRTQIDQLSTAELRDELRSNYCQKIAQMDEYVDGMSIMIAKEDTGLPWMNNTRKSVARRLATHAHGMDMCELLAHGEKTLYYSNIVNVLRYCGLSHAASEHLEECRQIYRRRANELYHEMYGYGSLSDLIIVPEPGDPVWHSQKSEPLVDGADSRSHVAQGDGCSQERGA